MESARGSGGRGGGGGGARGGAERAVTVLKKSGAIWPTFFVLPQNQAVNPQRDYVVPDLPELRCTCLRARSKRRNEKKTMYPVLSVSKPLKEKKLECSYVH